MNNKTAKMVQEAFKKDLGAEFSILEIKSMTRVATSGIDDEVYTLVDETGILFVARIINHVNGEPYNVLVKDLSVATIGFEFAVK